MSNREFETTAGWKLVPLTATNEMCDAAGLAVSGNWRPSDAIKAEAIYRAMLAAAPTPPASQKYAIAGTLSGILSMAGKMMGEDGAEQPTAPEEIAGVNIARLLRNLEETSYNEGTMDLACRLSDCHAVIKALLAAPAAVSHPTGDLTPAKYVELWLAQDLPTDRDWIYRDQVFEFARSIERAAIAAHLAHQPKAERCKCCGYLVTDSEHKSCIRAGAQNAEAIRNQWISVDERLPECNKKPGSLGVEVIVYPQPEKGESTAFFGCRLTDEPDFYKYGSRVTGVTHWMPIPPSPDVQTGSANTQEGDDK
jgi:hypothetical protein